MHHSVNYELIVTRERRRDLLRQAEQDQLIYLAKTGRRSSVNVAIAQSPVVSLENSISCNFSRALIEHSGVDRAPS